PEMVCVIKEYDGDDWDQPAPAVREALGELAQAIESEVSREGAAMLVAWSIGGDNAQAQFYVWARDEAQTRARIDALPGMAAGKPGEYATEHDPAWRIFFDEVIPAR
ncbi:MAG: hypothetical protein H0T42_02170, partial [Deltaproteobacteria bacterium]|nr:hypothetical protein [Deltaproteobacteria bacterium]